MRICGHMRLVGLTRPGSPLGRAHPRMHPDTHQASSRRVERAPRRPLGRTAGGRAAGGRRRDGSGRARERRHGRVATGDQSRLPLARRPRQPDRLGRRTDACAPARARRARRGRGERARADPARAVPPRLRPGRREPRVVLGARQPDARAGPRGAPRARESRTPSCRRASSPRPTGPSACARRTPRATPSSPGRSAGTGCGRPQAARRLRARPRPDPRLRGTAPLPVGAPRHRARAARRRRRAAGLRRPSDEPWIYDGRIVLHLRSSRT